MAKKETENNKISNNIANELKNLSTLTQDTNERTFGIRRDIESTLSNNVDNFIEKLNSTIQNDKSFINSYVTRSKLSKGIITTNNNNSLYDIIESVSNNEVLQNMIGTENAKFSQLLKDYEIIKRCIPQIHKVIVSLKNNIISPDAMALSAIGIETPASMDKSDKEKVNDLVEKYKLNEKLQKWVMNYLIASVQYVTVVPYSHIPDMLEENIPLSECIKYLEDNLDKPKSLLECTSTCSDILTESTTIEYYEDDYVKDISQTQSYTINPQELKSAVNECLSGIEFINGGSEYFKRAILNEAINLDSSLSNNKSMKSVIDKMRQKSDRVQKYELYDGLIDEKTVKDIRKKVDFKGCHIEELPASRVIPFRLRNTTIGYFYVEDIPGSTNVNRSNNLSSIMDKINASVYMKNNIDNPAKRIESGIIGEITEKLIKAINPKFIKDNYDDIDIIYEFVRVNELHHRNKRVVFFHPDDVCEFKREDGSIMKNCMFLAKLYILTMLSNVLANVTKGMDRNIHYVKVGLTTDIEGHVNSAIRAIKQGQIRYSDIGTINEIFNIVGSATDIFMPVSVDGERPIETETISGQNVDMNNDFLNSLLKSIVKSFGVPSSVIDDFENVEFAKTISMSNIDMAKAVLDAQNEINEPLTKLFRLIVSYEYPDITCVNSIYAKLNPPSVILFEINKERIESVMQMANSLSELVLPPNKDETEAEKELRIFKLNYCKKSLPTIDWNEIENIIKETKQTAIEEAYGVSINNSESGESQEF